MILLKQIYGGLFQEKNKFFDWETCKNVADFFANIIDYKSSFTSRHSVGVAEKASLLANYMGFNTINTQKMYLAGALHDIGKMAIGNEILEKPDKLTDDEFSKMKIMLGIRIVYYQMLMILRKYEIGRLFTMKS